MKETHHQKPDQRQQTGEGTAKLEIKKKEARAKQEAVAELYNITVFGLWDKLEQKGPYMPHRPCDLDLDGITKKVAEVQGYIKAFAILTSSAIMKTKEHKAKILRIDEELAHLAAENDQTKNEE